MCGTRLAENAGPKKVAKNRHLDTIAQLCRAIFCQFFVIAVPCVIVVLYDRMLNHQRHRHFMISQLNSAFHLSTYEGDDANNRIRSH